MHLRCKIHDTIARKELQTITVSSKNNHMVQKKIMLVSTEYRFWPDDNFSWIRKRRLAVWKIVNGPRLPIFSIYSSDVSGFMRFSEYE